MPEIQINTYDLKFDFEKFCHYKGIPIGVSLPFPLSNAKVIKRGEDFYATSSSVKSVDEGYEYVDRLLKIQEKEQEEYKIWFAKAIKSREVAKMVNDENSFPKLN